MPQADTPTDPLRIIASCDSFVLASVTVTTSPSVLIYFTRLNILSGSTVFLVAYLFPCVRFIWWLPTSMQHSVWVAGQTLPNKDFHLVSDKELSWRSSVSISLIFLIRIVILDHFFFFLVVIPTRISKIILLLFKVSDKHIKKLLKAY